MRWEKKNKKIIAIASLAWSFLLVIFLFSFASKFLLAQTTPTFNITVSTENGITDISGDANFYATSMSPDSTIVLSSLGFYFFPTTTDSGYYDFTATTTDYKNWSANIDTTYWPNGSYDFYAKGYYGTYTYENTPYISNHIIINVNNSSTTTLPLTMQFVNIPLMPFSGTVKLYAQTSETVDNVIFKIISNTGSETLYPGTSENNNQYWFDWPTASFTNDS